MIPRITEAKLLDDGLVELTVSGLPETVKVYTGIRRFEAYDERAGGARTYQFEFLSPCRVTAGKLHNERCGKSLDENMKGER